MVLLTAAATYALFTTSINATKSTPIHFHCFCYLVFAYMEEVERIVQSHEIIYFPLDGANNSNVIF